MLGDLRLAQPESIDKAADGGLPSAKGIEEFPAAAFSDGVEGIGRRRCSGHQCIICSYGYMSTSGSWGAPLAPHGGTGVDPLSWTPHSGGDPRGRKPAVGRSSIYPEEFRREACELVHRGDRSIRQVAAGLGIPDQTLCNWLKAEEKAKARGQESRGVDRVRTGRAQAPAQGERRVEDGPRDPAQSFSIFRTGDEPLSRFRFVSARRDQYPVKALCRVAKVSRSGYYAWASRPPSRVVSMTPIWPTPSATSTGARGAPMERLGSTASSVGQAPGSGANAWLASWPSWTWSVCTRARSGAGAVSTWLRLRTCSSATSAPATG